MGLGKTFMGSEKLHELSNKFSIVVCQKSKIDDWIEHFEEHYDYKVYNLTKPKKYSEFILKQDGVGIINYDIIWRRKEISNLTGFTLMLDESSCIKNETAKRTKFILKLRAESVILLSGTPVGGKYEELYSQIQLLGGTMSKKQFWSRYIVYKMVDFSGAGFKQPLVLGYKNTEELKEYLYSLGARFKKTEEVITLPDTNWNTIKVKKPKYYDTLLKDDIVQTDKELIVADTTLIKLLRLRQLCNSKEKQTALSDILDSTEDRLVIFYNFTEEKETIKKLLKKRPCSEINGQKKDLTAYSEKHNSVTLVQYQSGAMGLNLQKCNKMIYYSPPLSSELFEQSKKRIHRVGQNNSCFYYKLVCSGTVEEEIYETLSKRKDYTDDLFKRSTL